ncbi:DUF5360 family protein [Streptomyces sp. BBFR51]|uniref:DUF5360 family protein n=1 Tax=Streptomyces sp. BBFR51 TaxID=3372856 RepID=UPI0037DD2BBE
MEGAGGAVDSLMLVSLALTGTAGLQAVVFWALRGDRPPTWWIPNPALLLFPVYAITVLLRHGRITTHGPAARPPHP